MAMNIDRSLAFTALLEQYPPFRKMSTDEASRMTSGLMQAWEAYRGDIPGSLTFWAFASDWIACQIKTDQVRDRWQVICKRLEAAGVTSLAGRERHPKLSPDDWEKLLDQAERGR